MGKTVTCGDEKGGDKACSLCTTTTATVAATTTTVQIDRMEGRESEERSRATACAGNLKGQTGKGPGEEQIWSAAAAGRDVVATTTAADAIAVVITPSWLLMVDRQE